MTPHALQLRSCILHCAGCCSAFIWHIFFFSSHILQPEESQSQWKVKRFSLWCDKYSPKIKIHQLGAFPAALFAILSPACLCLHEKCGIWDAVMFPAGAHTLNAVYFAELMAASLNQHVGGWRAACTPKNSFDFLSGAALFISWSNTKQACKKHLLL